MENGTDCKTIQDAVEYLKEHVSRGEMEAFAAMDSEDIIVFHYGLGRWIRNEMGLWADNKELLEDCGMEHPDDASYVIMEAFWKHLRSFPIKTIRKE